MLSKNHCFYIRLYSIVRMDAIIKLFGAIHERFDDERININDKERRNVEYVNVAVNAMGGDNAPTKIVKGANRLQCEQTCQKYSW